MAPVIENSAASPRRRRRARSVPSQTSSQGSSRAGSGTGTPRGEDPSMNAGWQMAMMASLEQAGQEHAERKHVPTGFKLRNTFLEPDDGDSETSDAESLSSHSLLSSRSIPKVAEAPAQPPGSWVVNSESDAWEQLMAEVARSQDGDATESTKRVRPTKPRRMKGKQLAETLFEAQALSREARELAAKSFLQETSGEDALRAYACTVLRRLIEDAGTQ